MLDVILSCNGTPGSICCVCTDGVGSSLIVGLLGLFEISCWPQSNNVTCVTELPRSFELLVNFSSRLNEEDKG